MNYILLVLFICVEARIKIYLTDDPIQQIGAKFYKKTLLTDEYEDAKELTYDSSSRYLFFMYMDEEIQNSGRAFVNIITKQTGKIKGIARNKAIAVDTETSDVYFGSDDGLFKYDPLYNNASNIGLHDVNIMKLVIRDNVMYLLNANDHMLYKVRNDGTRTVPAGDWETVMEFEVDFRRNIHFVNISGLFCAVRGHETVRNINLRDVYHFLIDEEKVFGVTYDAIHEIHCENGTATKLTNINFYPRSIAFGDYGDIFYSTNDSIYRLQPVSSYVMYNIYISKPRKTQLLL